MSRRKGATLLEVMVVLAIFAILAGLSGASLAALRGPREPAWAGALRRARGDAARTGRPVTVRARDVVIVFLPDGRALGPMMDPLSGQPLDAPR